MSEEVTITEAEQEQQKQKQRRQLHNEYTRNTYRKYRDRYLAHRRRRYHSDENVRRRKLEYAWKYYRNNVDKIAAYQKAYRRGMRVRAI